MRCDHTKDLTLFLFCSYHRGAILWLSVVMGLRKRSLPIRGMRRSLTEEKRHKVAGAIVDHLEGTNWKIEHAIPRGTRATPDNFGRRRNVDDLNKALNRGRRSNYRK
jgi:hypothetical protein